MELSPKQQATELLKKSKKILLVGKASPDGDTIGSILAFSSVHKSLDKETVAVISGNIDSKYNFLPGSDSLKKEIEGTRDIILKLDVEGKEVEKLSYNIKDGVLNIIITPKGESYEEKDFSFSKGSYDFDLIVVLDTPDVKDIDQIYNDSANLFFEKPVINIDHHSGNEYFGTVNLVDTSATSTAEILVSLIEALGSSLLSKEIATNLLTGLIFDTDSFKDKKTTPKSLTVAAQLLAAGAKKEEIVRNIFEKKSFGSLRIWSTLYSNLHFDEQTKFAWTKISKKELFELGDLDLDKLTEEFLKQAEEADILLVLGETETGLKGVFKGQRGFDVLKVAELFGGNGDFYSAQMDLNGISFTEIETKVIKRIEEDLKARLGIRDENDGKRIFVPLQKLERKESEEEPIRIEETLKGEKSLEEEAVNEINQILTKESKEPGADEITRAIESLENENGEKKTETTEKKETMTPLSEILNNRIIQNNPKNESESTYDENEILHSENELVSEDDEEDGEIRVWRE